MCVLAYMFIGLIVGARFLQLAQRDVDTYDDFDEAEEILQKWAAFLIVSSFIWPWMLYYEIKLRFMSTEELKRLHDE